MAVSAGGDVNQDDACDGQGLEQVHCAVTGRGGGACGGFWKKDGVSPLVRSLVSV